MIDLSYKYFVIMVWILKREKKLRVFEIMWLKFLAALAEFLFKTLSILL